jgi:hypothetical protein
MNNETKRALEHARDDLGATNDPSRVGPEMTSQERGLGTKFMDYLIDRVIPEVGDMLVQKTAQGASELSMALNHEASGYTPYGYSQKPLEPLEIEGPATSYQDMLREAASREDPERSLGIDR